MRQEWTRTSSNEDAKKFGHFRDDLDLMLDAFRYTEDLVDRAGSEVSEERIVLRPAVGLDAGLLEWPKLISENEADMAEVWAPMRKAGILDQSQGLYSVATNGSGFEAVVCGALIRAKHIYEDRLTIAHDTAWDEHWDRQGTAVHTARDWVRTVFGIADKPVVRGSSQTNSTNLGDPSALDVLVGMQAGLREVEADAEARRRVRNKYIRSAAEDGHSLSAIAEVLGLSEAAVHDIVHE